MEARFRVVKGGPFITLADYVAPEKTRRGTVALGSGRCGLLIMTGSAWPDLVADLQRGQERDFPGGRYDTRVGRRAVQASAHAMLCHSARTAQRLRCDREGSRRGPGGDRR